MSSYTIEGEMHLIRQTEIKGEQFKVRTFVFDNMDEKFRQLIEFQATQDRVELLDKFKQGDKVRVHFNLKGRAWVKDGNTRYFNTLDAWRIESIDVQQPEPQPKQQQQPVQAPIETDLPF